MHMRLPFTRRRPRADPYYNRWERRFSPNGKTLQPRLRNHVRQLVTGIPYTTASFKDWNAPKPRAPLFMNRLRALGTGRAPPPAPNHRALRVVEMIFDPAAQQWVPKSPAAAQRNNVTKPRTVVPRMFNRVKQFVTGIPSNARWQKTQWPVAVTKVYFNNVSQSWTPLKNKWRIEGERERQAQSRMSSGSVSTARSSNSMRSTARTPLGYIRSPGMKNAYFYPVYAPRNGSRSPTSVTQPFGPRR